MLIVCYIHRRTLYNNIYFLCAFGILDRCIIIGSELHLGAETDDNYLTSYTCLVFSFRVIYSGGEDV